MYTIFVLNSERFGNFLQNKVAVLGSQDISRFSLAAAVIVLVYSVFNYDQVSHQAS